MEITSTLAGEFKIQNSSRFPVRHEALGDKKIAWRLPILTQLLLACAAR
jgi:hypothetical protein